MRWSYFFIIVLFVLSACSNEPQQEESTPKRTLPKNVKIDRKAGPIPTKDGTYLYYQAMGSGPAIIIPNGSYLAGDFKLLQDQYTLIFYDTRNRGRSQAIKDVKKLEGGIMKDVEDLETVRQHFKLEKVHLAAFGYQTIIPLLYTKQYPDRVEKIIKVSAMPPNTGKSYKVFQDSVNAQVAEAMTALDQRKDGLSDTDYCNEWWAQTRRMYTFVPGNAKRALAQVCQYSNERPRHMLAHYEEYILPSIQALDLKKSDFSSITQPVLVLHGTKDRVHALAGAKEWTKWLPNAKMAQIEIAGHLPWVDAQANVFKVMREFLQ